MAVLAAGSRGALGRSLRRVVTILQTALPSFRNQLLKLIASYYVSAILIAPKSNCGIIANSRISGGAIAETVSNVGRFDNPG